MGVTRSIRPPQSEDFREFNPIAILRGSAGS